MNEPWDDSEFPGKWLHGAHSLPADYDAWRSAAPPHETDDTCQKCGGYGEIETGPDSRIACDGDCGGTPERGKRKCWPCRGSGKLQKQEEKVASGVFVLVDVDCFKCRGSGRS